MLELRSLKIFKKDKFGMKNQKKMKKHLLNMKTNANIVMIKVRLAQLLKI